MEEFFPSGLEVLDLTPTNSCFFDCAAGGYDGLFSGDAFQQPVYSGAFGGKNTEIHPITLQF